MYACICTAHNYLGLGFVALRPLMQVLPAALIIDGIPCACIQHSY